MIFNYSLLNDFINGVSINKLTAELESTGIIINSISILGDIVAIDTTATDLTAQASIITNHDSTKIPDIRFYASIQIATTEQQITQGWGMIGRFLVNPSFFSENINNVFSHVIGEIKYVGSDVELRLLEDNTQRVLGSLIFSQTGDGTWNSFEFFTNVPPAAGGTNKYNFEARLNSASLAMIRYTTSAMLETV